MAITAQLVKELRERTGAGMMECKRALEASNGDIESAIKKMREAGQAKADKKSGRITAEGMIGLAAAGNKAVMLEVNSETDFVARDENFVNFVKQVSEAALENGVADMQALQDLTLGGDTVEQARQNLIAKIGENITLRRMTAMQAADHVGAYLHGGRIGVLVNLKGGDANLAKDIAMHIAASRPKVVLPEQVPEADIQQEKEIFVAQAKQSGKPDEIIEKMTTGRLKKYLAEVSLVGQAFVKDPSQTVAQLLKSANAEVVEFIRFEVGEGIEKKEDNFVEEVMAQVREG